MSYIKSIGQAVRGVQRPKIEDFPLTLNVALIPEIFAYNRGFWCRAIE